jgi:hypothetical protein
MKAWYQVVSAKDSRQLSEFPATEGQFLLPMSDLTAQAEMAVDELIDVAGRATIEAVLTLSARDLVGAIALRWAGSAYLATGKSFRRIMGFEQLWMLKPYLDRNEQAAPARRGCRQEEGWIEYGSTAVTNLQLHAGYLLCPCSRS